MPCKSMSAEQRKAMFARMGKRGRTPRGLKRGVIRHGKHRMPVIIEGKPSVVRGVMERAKARKKKHSPLNT